MSTSSSRFFPKKDWPYVVVGAMGLLAHLYWALPLYALQDRVMAWVLLCLLLASARQYVSKSRREPPIWLMIALQYYVMFALPQFFQEYIQLLWDRFTPSSNALSRAYFLVVLSEITLFSSAHLSRRFLGGVGARLWALAPDVRNISSRAIKIYSLLGLGVWNIVTFHGERVLPALMTPLRAVIDPFLALILLLYCQFARPREKGIPWGTAMAAAMAFVGLLQGVMENIVVPFFLLALMAWIYGKKAKISTVALVILVFIVLNPIKGIYRGIAWNKTFPSGVSGIVERLEVWADASAQFLQDPFAGSQMIESTAGRLDGILPYSEVVQMVPTPIPYRTGESLLTAMVYFVPRIIWEDKPGSSDIIYNQYAVEFGFLTQEGTETSTAGTNFLAEGYWDWGPLGSIAYASAMGAILAVLFSGKYGATSEGQVLIAAAFLAKVFQILIPFSVFLALLFSFCVGSLIALWGLSLVSRYSFPDNFIREPKTLGSSD